MRVTKREKGQKIEFTRGRSGSRLQCTTYSFLPAFLKFIKPIKPLISYLQGNCTFTSQLFTPRYPRRTWSVRGESELWRPKGEIDKLQSLQSQLVLARKSAFDNLHSPLQYSTPCTSLSALNDFQKREARGQNKADVVSPPPLILLPVVLCGLAHNVGSTYERMKAISISARPFPATAPGAPHYCPT